MQITVLMTSRPQVAVAFGAPNLSDQIYLTGESTRTGLSWRIIRGSHVSDRITFFQKFAAALQFPYYFGANWDALDECLHDLSRLRGNGVIILLDSFCGSLLTVTYLKRLIGMLDDNRIDPEDGTAEGSRRLAVIICKATDREVCVATVLEECGVSLTHQTSLDSYAARYAADQALD